jgi:hypothetical protein
MKNNSQRNHNSAGSKYPFNKRQKEIERQKKENPNQYPNKR